MRRLICERPRPQQWDVLSRCLSFIPECKPPEHNILEPRWCTFPQKYLTLLVFIDCPGKKWVPEECFFNCLKTYNCRPSIILFNTPFISIHVISFSCNLVPGKGLFLQKKKIPLSINENYVNNHISLFPFLPWLSEIQRNLRI